MQYRRNEYDVTDRVNLRRPQSVYTEVSEIISDFCPDAMVEQVHQAFSDLSRLYKGKLNGYLPCDVPFHDLQHVMDVTLAAARLLAGYEKKQPIDSRLGPERITLGIILALFHDCGYIRTQDDELENGAEYTKNHITRGEQFLRGYLPQIGLASHVEVVSRLIHYTGYEKPIEEIQLDDERDEMLGYIIGSADLFAQMADRCYLEKCRDRLYAEFVLGGMTSRMTAEGREKVLYHSPEELLRKTPGFYKHMVRPRLDNTFHHVVDYMKNFFNGQDPYQEEIDGNLQYVDLMTRENDFSLLRRKLTETPESRAFPYQRLSAC